MKTKKKMTPLGKRRRRRKRIKFLILAVLIALIVLGGYYTIKCCRIRKVVVRGNVTYTPGEIENQIKKEVGGMKHFSLKKLKIQIIFKN